MSLIKQQLMDLPITLGPEDCRGKTYIVTGANGGLGFECAKHLIEFEAQHVILAVRSPSKGKEALAQIEAATGRVGVGEVWDLDMASYASVQRFADRVKNNLDRIDGLVLNAAVNNNEWEVAEGLEISLTVNVVSTMLLAILLLPYMSHCAQAFGVRSSITTVSSGLAFNRQCDLNKLGHGNVFHDLSDPTKWSMDGMNRYSLSKLLLIFSIKELCALAPVHRTSVTVNQINPGVCKTGLMNNSGGVTKITVGALRNVLGREPEVGSRTLLHGISAGPQSHGTYSNNCQITDDMKKKQFQDEKGKKLSERVWTDLCAELDRIAPGCVEKALHA
ncbi:hypothetical protein S40293_00378 [Stachybotrys chartarum IBT 40293]|nr:hypothetical protein S40293_00378 [Stachybotrys chartarum IBT 40293]KFA70919.1 hypothetical protein S40288_10181 [Stachybotrys chartarum IBT 40288]